MSAAPSPRRRLPAVQEVDALGRRGVTVLWDEWAEQSRALVPPIDGGPWAGSVRYLPGEDRVDPGEKITRDHLVGEIIDPIVVATCPSDTDGAVRSLPIVRNAPLIEVGVFRRRPDVAGALLCAAPTIRAAVVEALIGGAVGDDGVIRSRIGKSEVAVDPRAWSWEIISGDGHLAAGRSLRGFAAALGGVGDGVLAVRLVETVLGWRLPIRVALTIADAIDAAPKPRGVEP